MMNTQENAAITQDFSSLSLEETMTALRETMETLENGSHTLEESFDAYQRGMLLVKQASQLIDKVEKKCLVLQEEGAAYEL